MRIYRIIPILAFFIIVNTLDIDAQCKAFAKKVCLPELGAYTHDGNYHAAVLVEGEEAELYKTFYSDMEYRVAICGEDKLQKLSSGFLMQVKMLSIQIRMQTMPEHGISNSSQASSLNWLLKLLH